MTDLEKVKAGLECLTHVNFAIYKSDCEKRQCPYKDTDCEIAVMEDAIALLKAQEPVKPVVDIDTLTCGNCGHTLEHQQLLGDNVLFHEQYNYCPDCGRAVKWE